MKPWSRPWKTFWGDEAEALGFEGTVFCSAVEGGAWDSGLVRR